jgi:XTP/dITP diphosphohydrolase
MRLLIATHNQGKKAEYAAILDDLPLELVTLTDLGIDVEIEETGTTFEENALLKARGYAAIADLVTLADDSGLEVDALDGAPGIHSARYAGPEAGDEDLYTLLLHNLRGVPASERAARFRCVIALVWPDGREETVEGVCEGRILREPRGSRGFGYDPVFYVPAYDKTMAQLPMVVKNRISHRGRAAEKAKQILKAALE